MSLIIYNIVKSKLLSTFAFSSVKLYLVIGQDLRLFIIIDSVLGRGHNVASDNLTLLS